MQHLIQVPQNNFPMVFTRALIEILVEGKEVRPRGQLTKEISPCTLVIDPLSTLLVSPKRNLNFSFLFAENLWYMSGRSDTHFLSSYNKNIKSFSEDGLHDGAYGPKIVSQLRHVIETLKNDPDSRQAIISIWRENPRPSKDVPCTSLFQFMIRDNKLNMYVTMRSNDIIWGTCYDVPSFALIQMIVASCLSLEVGTLYHTVNSLHLYETHFALAEELIKEEPPIPVMMKPFPPMSLENHTIQWDYLASAEGSLRNGFIYDHRPFLDKAGCFLSPNYYGYLVTMLAHHYRKRPEMISAIADDMEESNWVLAGWYKRKSEIK